RNEEGARVRRQWIVWGPTARQQRGANGEVAPGQVRDPGIGQSGIIGVADRVCLHEAPHPGRTVVLAEDDIRARFVRKPPLPILSCSHRLGYGYMLEMWQVEPRRLGDRP